LVALKLSLWKIPKFPPHLNPLPPGERKKGKWEKNQDEGKNVIHHYLISNGFIG